MVSTQNFQGGELFRKKGLIEPDASQRRTRPWGRRSKPPAAGPGNMSAVVGLTGTVTYCASEERVVKLF